MKLKRLLCLFKHKFAWQENVYPDQHPWQPLSLIDSYSVWKCKHCNKKETRSYIRV